MKQILMIENDDKIAALVGIHLKDIDCEMKHAANGADGLSLALTNHYDLIVLDLTLPDFNGAEVCKKLRLEKPDIPVIMLTARPEEMDKIKGAESGADDYLTKPFSIREFIARVKAMLRRAELQQNKEETEDKIVRGALVMDRIKHKVTLEDQEIEFSPKEFDLLLLLMMNPGRSYSLEQLLRLVWNYNFPGFEHTVNAHISRLRARIEKDPLHPEYILTTWGIGYRFTDEY